jgi:hypothetical protein
VTLLWVSSDSPLLTSTLGLLLIYASEQEPACAFNTWWSSYETDQRQGRIVAGDNPTPGQYAALPNIEGESNSNQG